MYILVSNDDGFDSRGITLLAAVAREFGDTRIVAPDRQQSAASHALSLHRPLRAWQVKPEVWAVDGTPTDCVNLAVNGLLDGRPDLIVSGINHGANLGDDITYSGTVAAAMEGCLLGIPALAFSFDNFLGAGIDECVAPLRKILGWCLQNLPESGTLYNINFPEDIAASRGVRITEQGRRVYGDAMVSCMDPRGRPYYWIGGNVLRSEPTPRSDIQAVADGYISLTPINLDLTDRQVLLKLQDCL